MQADDGVGQVVAGRYLTERVLGRGGMATVYAAQDTETGRQVALKLLRRELARDETVRKRFDREIQAASRLKHPNIIEVYDHGTDEDDAFIVMELAHGRDLLKALSQQRPMDPLRAVRILAQVCSALAVAHDNGVVHRDLKPENVVLVEDADALGGERAKVLDFGIAKVVAPPEGKSAAGSPDDPPSYVTKTALTRLGTIVGTPAYMSPEQCRAGEIDGRSDLYAAGVLLYQLVTGELPFSGETPLHTAMRHIHAPPKPPRQIVASLDPELEKTILRALAKWPGERQQSAGEMRDELLAIAKRLAAANGKTSEMETAPDANARLGRSALGAARLGSALSASKTAPTTQRDAEAAVTQPPPTTDAAGAAPSTDPEPSSDDDEPRTFLMTPEQRAGQPAAGGQAAIGQAAPAPQQDAPPAPPPGRKPTAPEVRTDQQRSAAPKALARTLPASAAQGLQAAAVLAASRAVRTLQSEKPPRPGRATETGLTPTLQRPLPPADDDDDDVSTFIREPGPAPGGAPHTAPAQPGVPSPPPSPTPSPARSAAASPPASVAGQPEHPWAKTGPPSDLGTIEGLRSMKATSRLEQGEPASTGVSGAMLATQRMVQDPQAAGFPGPRPDATMPSGSVAPPPSSNMMRALPTGGWNDPTSLTRRPTGQAPSGVVGQLAALPGTTGFLIGIGLGLGIAAGVIVALLVMR